MATRTLEITFIGDAKPVTKAFGDVDDAGGKLTAKMSGLQGAFGGVASVAGGVLAAGALTKLTGGLGGAIAAAAEDEQATMRLEQALRNAGGAFDENKAKVDARIASMQKLAFSDDDVRDSFQVLLAATGDVNESLKRQALAADVARGANIPLEKASLLLGKVTAENVEQFKRMGITIGEGASEAEAFAALQEKFGGQAQAYANSTAGQFEQAKIQMAELKESIGAALLPVITTLATVLATQVVPAMTAVFGFIMDHKGEFVAGIAGIAAVIVTAMIPATLAWAAAEWAKVTALLAAAAAFVVANAPMIALALAIGVLVAGIILLIQHWDEITAKFPVLGQAADAIKAKFEVFTGWLSGTFVPAVLAIYTGVKDALDQAIAYVRDHADDIKNAIEPPLKALELIAKAAFEQVKIQIETYLGIIKGIVDVFMGIFTGDWDRAWNGVKEIVSSVWNGIKGTIENVIGLIKGLAPLMKEAGMALLDAFWEGMKGIGGKLEEVIQAIGKGIANGVIAIVNQAINTINDMIPDKISLKGLPDIDLPDNPIPTIPALAAGGIVTRPTLALIGEAGPEAVVPLGRGKGVGTTVELHIHGNYYGDPGELAELVKREFDRAY